MTDLKKVIDFVQDIYKEELDLILDYEEDREDLIEDYKKDFKEILFDIDAEGSRENTIREQGFLKGIERVLNKLKYEYKK